MLCTIEYFTQHGSVALGAILRDWSINRDHARLEKDKSGRYPK